MIRSRAVLAAILVLILGAALGACSESAPEVDAAPPPESTAPPTTVDPGTSDDEGGTIHEEADPVPPTVREPVPMDGTADVGRGITVRLSERRSTQVEASLPGERSGPGVAITVEVHNGSDRTIVVDDIVVDLVDRDGLSATPVVDPDHEPLRGEVVPGATASGTYDFFLPTDKRTGVTVSVKHSPTSVTVRFAGDAPA